MTLRIEPQPTNPGRVPALDAIRFLAALAVVYWHVAHVAWPLPPAPDGVALAARSVLRTVCNGPAAVVVFFVISGFCIHFPFRNVTRIDTRAFLAHRFLRIGLPFAAALALAMALGWKWMALTWASFGFLPATASTRDVDPTVFWSLIAEMSYYALYPALFALSLRTGWQRIALVSYVPALAVTMLAPRTGEFQGFGNALAPVVALPAWLWGCVLAETWDRWHARSVPAASLWAWRGAVVAGAAVTLVLRYHAPAALAVTQLPWTLHPFALMVCAWLRREIACARHHPLPRLLERGGAWSYSLYLAHLGALEAWLWLARGPVGAWPVAAQLPLQAGVLLALCYLFHRAIELPSWRLARAAGARLRRAGIRVVPAEPIAEPVADGLREAA